MTREEEIEQAKQDVGRHMSMRLNGPARTEKTLADALTECEWERDQLRSRCEQLEKGLQESSTLNEEIRVILVDELDDPLRQAFWKAVKARDVARAVLESTEPEIDLGERSRAALQEGSNEQTD